MQCSNEWPGAFLWEKKHRNLPGEREDDEETSDKSSDSDTKSTSCSNSNDEENEKGSDNSKENEFGDSTVFQLIILILHQTCWSTLINHIFSCKF